MSDETDDNSNGKKDRGERVRVEPTPSNPDFAEWVEKLFYDEPEVMHCPEHIDLCVVSGRNCDKIGRILTSKHYAPSTASEEATKKMPGKLRKPTKAQIVALSNEFLRLAQVDCDQSGKSTVYGVFAWHMAVGADPYASRIIRCRPSGRYAKEGATEDDEDLPIEKRFSLQSMKHLENMISLLAAGFDGIMDRQDRLNESLMRDNERLRARNNEQQDIMEKLRSNEVEREDRRLMAKLKEEGLRRGLDLASVVIPPLVNQLVGKPVVPAENLEIITLREFFKITGQGGKFTQEQALAMFGNWDDSVDPPRCLQPGILTKDQANLIIGIVQGELSPDELDKLIAPDSPLCVSPEQAMALQQHFKMEQLAPILLILEARRKKFVGQ